MQWLASLLRIQGDSTFRSRHKTNYCKISWFLFHSHEAKKWFIRRRVSKYVTNGSWTAVMDVIGSLCVSLESSTIQHLGIRRACAWSEAGVDSQNGDRVWGVYWRREALYCALFCRQKDSMQSIFIKKCFLFTLGSVCCIKRSRNSLMDVRKSQIMNGDAEVAETTVKCLLCCEFRRTDKAMGQVYQWWWRICREIYGFFQVRM
jgi:hypothetical protein